MKTQLTKRFIAAIVAGSFIAISLQSCEKVDLATMKHSSVLDTIKIISQPTSKDGRFAIEK